MNIYSILERFQGLNDHFRFAAITAFVAFLSGLYWYTIPMASEHIYFFISAPIATYLPALLTWKMVFKSRKDFSVINVIALSFFLTLISHYLNFVILGIGRLIESWFSEYAETESLLGSLTYISWLRMTISLYYTGILTLILFIITGVFVIRTSKI